MNLNAQYDEVVVKLTEYSQFSRRISQRLFHLKSMKILFKFSIRYNREFMKRDRLTLKNLGVSSEIARLLATPEEVEDSKFQIMLSIYPDDSLSRYLESEFPNFDFDKLSKLHQIQLGKYVKNRLSVKNVLGMVFGVGSLILQFTPKPVVESFQCNYDSFQIAVFWITLGVVAYVGIVIGITWISENRLHQRNESISEILDYTALRLSSSTSANKE
jgi:hypothetical protein